MMSSWTNSYIISYFFYNIIFVLSNKYNMDDFDWIREYELKPYHEVETSSLQCFYLFHNKENELINIKSSIYLLKKANMISKEELLGLIKAGESDRHSLKNQLIFNVNLKFDDVSNFVCGDDHKSMLKEIEIKDQMLFPSIDMFQQINSLFFVYGPRKLKSKNTKKVFINTGSRKTKKKRT